MSVGGKLKDKDAAPTQKAEVRVSRHKALGAGRSLGGGGSRVLRASAGHCKEGGFLEEGREAPGSSAPAARVSADGRGGRQGGLALGSLKPRHPRDVPGGAEATEPCATLSSRSCWFLMSTPFFYRGDRQVTALYTSLYILNLAQDIMRCSK